MRNRLRLFLVLIMVVAALSTVLYACGNGEGGSGGEAGYDPFSSLTQIALVDDGGSVLFTISKDDLANTVKTYTLAGNLQNVYSWNCVVTGSSGATQEVTVIKDGKLVVDTVKALLALNITKIAIYPATYYTLLTYGENEYKAVYDQIPNAIPPAVRDYQIFVGYYAEIGGAEVQLTDASGAFMKKWEYVLPTLP